MSPYIASLFTVAALAAVHIGAGTVAFLQRRWQSRALSAAAEFSVCWVLIELLPESAGTSSVRLTLLLSCEASQWRGIGPLVWRQPLAYVPPT